MGYGFQESAATASPILGQNANTAPQPASHSERILYLTNRVQELENFARESLERIARLEKLIGD